MKQRVFVSSVMRNFDEYRQAAKRAISEAGGDPVLIEDSPSLPVSSRTACLDGVASCDIYIVIIGKRGGWISPSGKLVTEEEYEEARKKKLPILAFIQNVEYDQDAQKFIDSLSDYVDGVYRKTFNTASELEPLVMKALLPIIQHFKEPKMESRIIQEILEKPITSNNEAILRFVIFPERDEQVLEPVSLESEELKRQILEIGHSQAVDLFSYECPKSTKVEINEIIISQSDGENYRYGSDKVRLEINTKGIIIIDINVTGRPREERSNDFSTIFAIIEDDLSQALRKCFLFTKAFFDSKDPYKRYDRFMYNTAILNIGNRTILKELPKNGSYSMGFNNENTLIAFEQAPLLTRADLGDTKKEIETITTLFRRRINSRE